MRRHIFRRPRATCTRSPLLLVVLLLPVVALVWYSFTVNSVIKTVAVTSHTTETVVQHAEVVIDQKIGCVAWRQTLGCSPFGSRETKEDKACDYWIRKDAGYCECTGGLTTNRFGCGHHPAFRCKEACEALNKDLRPALKLPANVTCPLTRGTYNSTLSSLWHISSKLRSQRPQNVGELDVQAASLWQQVMRALGVAGRNVVHTPGLRDDRNDWVRDGSRMSRQDILRARQQWQTFMHESPAYPARMFSGRGIVILAGGLTYMVPAWVNVHMLRRTGCTLPVEMFFPIKEYPTPALEAALAQVGVVCRRLPNLEPAEDLHMTDDGVDSKDGKRDIDLSGFTMKIAALLLSRFQEVLFLDSDNVAIRDPAVLFESPEFLQTGALLWPDYWDSSAAPDLQLILGEPSLPSNTFESGQMVFDKSRVWGGLMLAAFFNMQSELYYDLFSNYMGKGDKESFAHALRAMQLPYHLVHAPVGSVGLSKQRCDGDQRHCWFEFAGNSMTQHSPDGQIMFLHTNLSPKWSLEVPGDFEHYHRRWQIVQPGGHNFEDVVAELGADLEQEIYRLLVALRCAPFLPSYVEVLSRSDRMGKGKQMPMGLQGFHPLNNGVDFRLAYRWGLKGPYLAFQDVDFQDRFQYFKNTWIKGRLGRLKRLLRWLGLSRRRKQPS